MSFGKRLEAIGAMVSTCEKVVDVGTDHAYLPVLLVKKQKIKKAIATDIAAGPCEAARHTVTENNLADKIEVRQADGLLGVTPKEAETVIMAGMGAATMVHILQAAPQIIPGIRELILQPMNDSEVMRHWAEEHNWKIVTEDLVEEGDKIYEILQLIPKIKGGPEPQNINTCYQVGSYLVEHQHPLLKKFVTGLLHKYSGLLTAMDASPKARNSEKYQEFNRVKRQLEEILNEKNNSN